MPREEFEIAPNQAGLRTLRAWNGYGSRVSVPEGIEAIGDDALSGKNVRQVDLPASLRFIGRRAFSKCLRLEELRLPDSVEEIDVEAFKECASLRGIEFGKGLQKIQARAFWYCSRLEKVELPESVQLIASRAFEGCSALRQVAIRNPGAEMDEYVFSETPYWNRLLERAEQCGIGKLGATPQCPETLILPEGMVHIDMWAYSKSRIRKAILPGSLRTIGRSAFRDCKELTEVSMSPNTYSTDCVALEVNDGIFSGCSSLRKVVFRGTLKHYPWYNAGPATLLRGFYPQRTFAGCVRLHAIEAWQVPFRSFPEEWRQYALNSFLEDGERDSHYLPEIVKEYDEALRGVRNVLIRRCERDHSWPLHQYLLSREVLDRESWQTVFDWAKEGDDPQVMAALLEYKDRRFAGARTADTLLKALNDL